MLKCRTCRLLLPEADFQRNARVCRWCRRIDGDGTADASADEPVDLEIARRRAEERRGRCMIRSCPYRAKVDGLCRPHDRKYRPKCRGCGREHLHDRFIRKGRLCGSCSRMAVASRFRVPKRKASA